jgi:hypothetical protein
MVHHCACCGKPRELLSALGLHSVGRGGLGGSALDGVGLIDDGGVEGLINDEGRTRRNGDNTASLRAIGDGVPDGAFLVEGGPVTRDCAAK